MQISARNQFQGEIIRIDKGAVNTEVVLRLHGGQELASIITNASADRLGLKEGGTAHALIKASSILLAATDSALPVSARNQLCGTVTHCETGAVNGEVTIQLAGTLALTTIITNASIAKLGLKPGAAACALIKASDVLLMTD